MSNMDDITKRLREEAACTEELHPGDSEISVMREAEREIEMLRKERNELWADLAALREATRIRLSKKARHGLGEMLEAMEAMDDEEAPALRCLLEIHDKLTEVI
jgi:hypothetical protein